VGNEGLMVELALIALVVIHDLIWNRRFDKLLDRFMARDLKEFQYFQKKYDNDVQAVEDVRKHDKKKLAILTEQMKKDHEEEQRAALEEEDAFDAEEASLYQATLRRVPLKPGAVAEKESGEEQEPEL